MASFNDLVKQHGSVSAALQAQGYAKNDSGSWSKSSGSSSGSSAPVSSTAESKPAAVSSSISGGIAKSSSSSGSTGSSSAASSGSGSVYGVPTVNRAANQEGFAVRDQPSMARRTDLAGQYATSGGYTVFYDDNGYATKAVKGHVDYTPQQDYYVQNGSYSGGNLWTDEEMLTASDLGRIEDIRSQMRAGQITSDQANHMANQIRSGYGYTIDKAGNVTGLGALSAVDARRQAWGLPTNETSEYQRNYLNAMFPESQSGDRLAEHRALTEQSVSAGTPQSGQGVALPEVGGYDLSGYGSFEEFLNAIGYGDYTSATQQAIQAAVQSAIDQYNQQIQATNDDSDELARQAYIAKMLGQRNLDQQLAASGYAGGIVDTHRIATETAYQNQLNALEMQRAATVRELESAITNARLSGDMQTAQELAGYLQQVQGQWVSYVQNQQAMANQNYWNQAEMENQNYWKQQNLNAQQASQQYENSVAEREYAYSLAMTMLESGIMPDNSTLATAGISLADASGIQKSAQKAIVEGGGVSTKTSGSGTLNNKPTITYSQMMDALNSGLVTPGVLQAYEYYMGTPLEIIDRSRHTESDTSDFGSSYDIILRRAKNMQENGKSPQTIATFLDGYSNAQLTDAGMTSIINILFPS